MAKIRSGSLRWVRETSNENARKTDGFIEQAIMQALSRVNNANLGFAIYDENDERISTTVFERFVTPPSQAMQEQMEFEFADEEVPAVTA